jgi:hypothetical protein
LSAAIEGRMVRPAGGLILRLGQKNDTPRGRGGTELPGSACASHFSRRPPHTGVGMYFAITLKD